MVDRSAGVLCDRLHFQARGLGDDGWGNHIPGGGAFETQFTASAGLRPRTGGEGVDAARLTGRQPYVVLVRRTPQTEPITVSWQLVDARNPARVLAVASPPADPDGKG
jgi:hypothetical protein